MKIRIALVALVVSSLAALSLSGCDMSKVQPQAQSQVRTEEQVRPIEGKPFPKIALEAASGKTLSTDAFRGKVVVLNVWAAWCPPCRREMPSLEALSKRLDTRRFAVVGLSTDDDAMLAREFLRQNDITFANFFDRNGRISRQFDLEVYPETFLIGPDGTLIQRVPGMRDWSSPEMVAFLEMTYDTYSDHIARRAE
jgi:peroxiredoxin